MAKQTNSTQIERDLFKNFLKSKEYGSRLWIQFVNIHHTLHPNKSLENYLEQNPATSFICNLIAFSQAGEWEQIQNEWRDYLSNFRSNTQNK